MPKPEGDNSPQTERRRKGSLLPKEAVSFRPDLPSTRYQVTRGDGTLFRGVYFKGGTISWFSPRSVPEGDVFQIGAGTQGILKNSGESLLEYRELVELRSFRGPTQE